VLELPRLEPPALRPSGASPSAQHQSPQVDHFATFETGAHAATMTWADDGHFLPTREAETVVARRSLEMMSTTADIAEETILT
jgi:hypothetical protein